MGVRLVESRLRGALVEARLPFRFGIAEMNELVHVLLFVTMDIDSTRQFGVAADNLPPKWFTKNPETSYRDDVIEMLGIIESACAIAGRSGRHASVFDLWYDVYRERVLGSDSGTVLLLASFGVSLVERAVIDSFCRARNVSFGEAVRTNTLGVRLGDLHPELAGHEAREFLPTRPLTSMSVRHTVGLSDRLAGSEGGAADDLPATLEASVRRYGLRRFKVKVSGNREVDLDRLDQVRRVLDSETRGDYRITLDGNEQFRDVPSLRTFWEDMTASDGTAALGRRVDYVEQPLPRDLALGADTSAALAAWPGRPRLTIDESDDSLDAVVRAIEAGYDGGAFKSSKGVFKGIGNACRVEQLRQEHPGRRFIYSAEDLSTIPPVGLLADLAVIATLGIDEPERNGYHYLRSLSGLPSWVELETVRHHGDLFSLHSDGRAVLKIEQGRISVESVVTAPFGVGWHCDFEEQLDSVDSLLATIP